MNRCVNGLSYLLIGARLPTPENYPEDAHGRDDSIDRESPSSEARENGLGWKYVRAEVGRER